MKTKLLCLVFLLVFIAESNVFSQGDGSIIRDGEKIFPIGWYYMPKEDAKLKELANAGINIVRCNSKEALDRAQAAGLMGWMPLKLQDGITDKFKEQVSSVANHPALALWEGPDEVVWNYQAWSGLYRQLKVHEKPNAWWDQTPGAVKYAKDQSNIVNKNMISAISYLRSVDTFNRQIWINEASQSDVEYVRQYLDFVDITGCDNYPISGLLDPKRQSIRRSVDNIRFYTQRYMEIGRGKPVYMILQAFSWPELGGEQYSGRPPAYPSFNESRYMAYISIAYGARGIYYWGGSYTKSEEFLQSVFAVTNELNALQPFLTSPQEYVKVRAIKGSSVVDNTVSCFAGRSGRDWMVAVINETDTTQMGVVIENLKFMNGMKLTELYGNEELTVSNEEIILRMKPREVKVFATGRKWETKNIMGRDFKGK